MLQLSIATRRCANTKNIKTLLNGAKNRYCARQYSTAKTLAPGIDRVRWFYAKDRALSKPQLADWKKPPQPAEQFEPFNRHDSERLEAAFQAATPARVPVLEDQLFEVELKARTLSPVYWDGPVFEVRRGTWFVNDVGSRDGPCPEPLAEELERLYTKDQAKPPGDEEPGAYKLETEVNVDQPVQEPYKEEKKAGSKYVTFDEDGRTAALVSSDQWSAVLRPLVALGGTKVVRGYEMKREKPSGAVTQAHKETLAMVGKARGTAGGQLVSEGPSEGEGRPVDHLVICIHGIGQRLGQRIESISFVQDINVFRKLLKEVYVQSEALQDQARQYVAHKHGSSKLARLRAAHTAEKTPEFSTNHRLQVLPLIWRHDIQFGMTREDVERLKPGSSNGGQDVSLEDITVDGIGPLRSVIADVVLDVLLYYQPAYHAQIIEATVRQLNQIYNKFCERNPEFAKNPRVSVVGHSLGSAIAFDIVSSSRATLDFEVDIFFGVGSPVGMFQMLKGNRIGPGGVLPRVKDYYNVFHPSDPVAYRVDPLVHRDAALLAPLEVPFAEGTFPSQVQALQRLSARFASEASNMWNMASKVFPFGGAAGDTAASIRGKGGSTANTVAAEAAAAQEKRKKEDAGEVKKKEFEALADDVQRDVRESLRALNRSGQIDHALPVQPLDIAMVSALASHVSYFESADLANLVLQAVYSTMEKKM